MMQRKKRIALIGPESTGKTTLCFLLAEHYQTVWVKEYSRDYIAIHPKPYSWDDVVHCTEEQIKLENQMLSIANNFLFADTELIVAKVWFNDVFKREPAWLEEKICERMYDLYLLTFPDIAFVQDTVRENPRRREFFFNWYREELQRRKVRYAIITGDGKSRLQNAINIIDKTFGGK
jgi:NadR type nicotinamide-nucleotide adenylyltransferase